MKTIALFLLFLSASLALDRSCDDRCSGICTGGSSFDDDDGFGGNDRGTARCSGECSVDVSEVCDDVSDDTTQLIQNCIGYVRDLDLNLTELVISGLQEQLNGLASAISRSCNDGSFDTSRDCDGSCSARCTRGQSTESCTYSCSPDDIDDICDDVNDHYNLYFNACQNFVISNEASQHEVDGLEDVMNHELSDTYEDCNASSVLISSTILVFFALLFTV